VATEQAQAVDDLRRALAAPRPMPPSETVREAIDSYTTGGAESVNNALRSGWEIEKGYRQEALDLAAAIGNSPSAMPRTLYRAMPRAITDQWVDGAVMVDPAFVSTSSNPRILSVLEDTLLDNGLRPASYVQIQIDIPQGYGALDVNATMGRSYYSREQSEVLLAPGGTFNVARAGDTWILKAVKP
jgi:hypothetical protein